jgi:hypothetical protein
MFLFIYKCLYFYVQRFINNVNNIIYTMEKEMQKQSKKSADIRIKDQTPLYDMEKLKAFYGYRTNKKTVERSLRECVMRFISEK